jgi:hypothetical protein
LGDYSLAAGNRAKANHNGTFVWADSTATDFASSGPNQFLIRASGGVGIGKTNPQTALDVQGTITVSAPTSTGSAFYGSGSNMFTPVLTALNYGGGPAVRAITTGDAAAVIANSGGTNGFGVSASGDTGVFALGESLGVKATGNDGVYGLAVSDGIGVRGDSAEGAGVLAHSSTGIGLVAVSATGYGVQASGGNIGVYAHNFRGPGQDVYLATASLAGDFYGDVVFHNNVTVYGNISKGGGSFKIDHPLDPEHKYLYHSFVESPDMKNIYDGIVTLDAHGTAVVELPAWFEALNQDFRYQLTAVGGPAPNLHIAKKIQGNRFKIAGGSSGLEVSWLVTGIRHDAYANAHRIPVEEDKAAADVAPQAKLFGQ